MTRTSLLGVTLEAIESASSGNRRLDAEVDAALFGGWPSHWFSRETPNSRLRASYGPGVVFHDSDPDVNGGHVLTSHHRNASAWTTSIDAADALVARALPGSTWLRKDPRVATVAISSADPKGWAMHHDGLGTTFALSLVAAVLRATIASADQANR